MNGASFEHAIWTALAERSGDSAFAWQDIWPGCSKAASRCACRRSPRHLKAAERPNNIRLICLCLAFIGLLICENISHAATNDFFTQGVESARTGDFSDAATSFQKSVQSQPSSGALVNLGVAEWRRGHAGAAVLAWEQARWLDPFDPRAMQNLKFARTAAQLDEPELRWFEVASTWLPPNLWVWLAGASLWLAVGALILPPVFRWKKSGGQQTLAALGFGIFLFAVTANLGVVCRTEIGFVLKKNVSLRLTPTSEGEVISTLTDGEPARKLRTRGNYFFIRTANGTGWIEQTQFGLINPD